MQEELGKIFADQQERGLFDEASYNDDAPMELLADAGRHSAMAKLCHLHGLMPNEATRLGVAFGMLFALRLWTERPDLAQHVVDCERTRDEAEDRDLESLS